MAGKFNSSSYPMTVAELIEKLQEFNPNTPVWVSKDPEGNGFHALYEVQRLSVDDAEQFMDEPPAAEIVMLWP